MEIFRSAEFAEMENPAPGTNLKREILTTEHKAESLGGLVAIILAGSQIPYHFHARRESIIIAISGEATEIVEGREFPVKTGDVLFIPPMEKHMLVNRTDRDFRYLEFFTCPPVAADFIEVK